MTHPTDHGTSSGTVASDRASGSGLTGVLAEANSFGDGAGVRVPNPQPIKIRSEPIPQLIFGLIYLLFLTRFLWPLELPLPIKIVVAVLALVALQFHRWSELSSGSMFSPEFPRPVVALFNWAFGTIALLALLQLGLDVGLLVAIPFNGGIVSAPESFRYGLAA